MAFPLRSKPSNGTLHGNTENTKQVERVSSSLPENFGEVIPGMIYRSSFPLTENLGALEKLNLKSIITFVEEPYSNSHIEFLERNKISHLRIVLDANKVGRASIDDEAVKRILMTILSKERHPILIHCNKGKHRTGCVVACFRKAIGWPLDRIIREYRDYAGSKARALDEVFISKFNAQSLRSTVAATGAAAWIHRPVPSGDPVDVLARRVARASMDENNIHRLM
ncbi:hypothetical protein ASPZODRAFT_18307 [Penicilliopsis zonata CBS 506.65]|uniref:Tyrosine specific protein phosphatases domain-containing protein n=1 Tax=Penicilliopsis zonata CBS 506.65 TaxID=1073090 RepID=A0A1L9SC37_9EURO|nr:hypothetical protein ASPZODRAFT_18307 [Penicilliopsis zonata CBS 506.65]OJJ44736.1 hypothetical protein ASPZODRAFT_18307 [Penicilliopsis zonata CBS 506.65]